MGSGHQLLRLRELRGLAVAASLARGVCGDCSCEGGGAGWGRAVGGCRTGGGGTGAGEKVGHPADSYTIPLTRPRLMDCFLPSASLTVRGCPGVSSTTVPRMRRPSTRSTTSSARAKVAEASIVVTENAAIHFFMVLPRWSPRKAMQLRDLTGADAHRRAVDRRGRLARRTVIRCAVGGRRAAWKADVHAGAVLYAPIDAAKLVLEAIGSVASRADAVARRAALRAPSTIVAVVRRALRSRRACVSEPEAVRWTGVARSRAVRLLAGGHGAEQPVGAVRQALRARAHAARVSVAGKGAVPCADARRVGRARAARRSALSRKTTLAGRRDRREVD